MALTSQEIVTMLPNNQEEPSGVPNLPGIVKWLPVTRPEHLGLVQGTAPRTSGT